MLLFFPVKYQTKIADCMKHVCMYMYNFKKIIQKAHIELPHKLSNTLTEAQKSPGSQPTIILHFLNFNSFNIYVYVTNNILFSGFGHFIHGIIQ